VSPDLDVGIVGGGVAGLSLARALARAGAAVTLHGSDAFGADGASAVPVALLNPFRGRSGRARPDDLAALAVTWRWAAELRAEGFDPGAERSGVVRVADGPRQARSFATVEGLRPFAAASAPPPFRAPHGGAWGDAGGWVDPRRWTAALAGSAAAAGAVLRPGRPVAALEPRPGGGWRLLGVDGSAADVARLIVATGAHPWPQAWARSLTAPAFERIAGDVVVTRLAAPPWPLAGAVYLGPVASPAGPVAAVGGHHRPPGAPAPDAGARLTSALAWAWPRLLEADTDVAVWWGIRAHGEANRPQFVELAPDAWWMGALAGRGFLAAAALAEAAAMRLMPACVGRSRHRR
jgi:glycine/D-amino acid oxidase-like deaminating enzyme